ncbi:MAG TPA: hypothetical protein VME66_07105, partial [Candidatus Acidoferrales bacterium]|nr:hypothetical protein [Candidatus Acidoferrales bacterium]
MKNRLIAGMLVAIFVLQISGTTQAAPGVAIPEASVTLPTPVREKVPRVIPLAIPSPAKQEVIAQAASGAGRLGAHLVIRRMTRTRRGRVERTIPLPLPENVQLGGTTRKPQAVSTAQAPPQPSGSILYPGDSLSVDIVMVGLNGYVPQPPCSWTLASTPPATVSVSIGPDQGCTQSTTITTTASTPPGTFTVYIDGADAAGVQAVNNPIAIQVTVLNPNQPLPLPERPCLQCDTQGGGPIDFADGEERYSYADLTME